MVAVITRVTLNVSALQPATQEWAIEVKTSTGGVLHGFGSAVQSADETATRLGLALIVWASERQRQVPQRARARFSREYLNTLVPKDLLSATLSLAHVDEGERDEHEE